MKKSVVFSNIFIIAVSPQKVYSRPSYQFPT